MKIHCSELYPDHDHCETDHCCRNWAEGEIDGEMYEYYGCCEIYKQKDVLEADIRKYITNLRVKMLDTETKRSQEALEIIDRCFKELSFDIFLCCEGEPSLCRICQKKQELMGRIEQWMKLNQK